MDWIQLVLPSEGMQASILAYGKSFENTGRLPPIDWEKVEQDYYDWICEQTDRMLGILQETEYCYFALDTEDKIVASVHLEDRQNVRFYFRPDFKEMQQLKNQLYQQLKDWEIVK